MTKSPISAGVILLALAAIVPFSSAQLSFGISPTFSSHATRYESIMRSQAEEVIEKVESHVSSVGGKLWLSGHIQTALNTPVIGQTVTCLSRKLEPTKRNITEFSQVLIKLISYVRALGLEIRRCLLPAPPGAPKAGVCITDITGRVAQASIEHVQNLVLTGVKIIAAASGLSTTIQNCALYNN